MKIEFTVENFIRAFWYNSGAQESFKNEPEIYKALEAALYILIQYGPMERQYDDFCAYLASPLSIKLDKLISLYGRYRFFVLKSTNIEIRRMGYGFAIDRYNEYDILQRTAGYIKTIMRKYNYRDVENTRYTTAAITGSIPEDLPDGTDMDLLKAAIMGKIEKAIQDGFSSFYVYLNRGAGLIAADCLTSLKLRHEHIHTHFISSYAVLPKNWRKHEMTEYMRLVHVSDENTVLTAPTKVHAYNLCHRHIIDRSDRLINLHMRENAHPVSYAKKMGLDIVSIPGHAFMRRDGT